MTLHVFLHVVAEVLSFVAQSTMVCYLPDMALHVYCFVIPEASSEYFIYQELCLPQKCLQHGQNPVRVFLATLCLFLPPGSRNHPILLHGVFNIARILLGNAGLAFFSTIPSTSNHNFFLQGAFNSARIMLDIANLPLTISSTRNYLFLFYTIA